MRGVRCRRAVAGGVVHRHGLVCRRIQRHREYHRTPLCRRSVRYRQRRGLVIGDRARGHRRSDSRVHRIGQRHREGLVTLADGIVGHCHIERAGRCPRRDRQRAAGFVIVRIRLCGAVAGGVVHRHGLAARHIQRHRERGLTSVLRHRHVGDRKLWLRAIVAHRTVGESHHRIVPHIADRVRARSVVHRDRLRMTHRRLQGKRHRCIVHRHPRHRLCAPGHSDHKIRRRRYRALVQVVRNPARPLERQHQRRPIDRRTARTAGHLRRRGIHLRFGRKISMADVHGPAVRVLDRRAAQHQTAVGQQCAAAGRVRRNLDRAFLARHVQRHRPLEYQRCGARAARIGSFLPGTVARDEDQFRVPTAVVHRHRRRKRHCELHHLAGTVNSLRRRRSHLWLRRDCDALDPARADVSALHCVVRQHRGRRRALVVDRAAVQLQTVRGHGDRIRVVVIRRHRVAKRQHRLGALVLVVVRVAGAGRRAGHRQPNPRRTRHLHRRVEGHADLDHVAQRVLAARRLVLECDAGDLSRVRVVVHDSSGRRLVGTEHRV